MGENRVVPVWGAQAEGRYHAFVQDQRHGSPAGQGRTKWPQTAMTPQEPVDRPPCHADAEVDRLAQQPQFPLIGGAIQAVGNLSGRNQGRGCTGADPLFLPPDAVRHHALQWPLCEVCYLCRHQSCEQADSNVGQQHFTPEANKSQFLWNLLLCNRSMHDINCPGALNATALSGNMSQ